MRNENTRRGLKANRRPKKVVITEARVNSALAFLKRIEPTKNVIEAVNKPLNRGNPPSTTPYGGCP